MIETVSAVAHAATAVGAQQGLAHPGVEMSTSLPKPDAAGSADFAAARDGARAQDAQRIQEVRAQPIPEQGGSSSRFMDRLTGVTDYITRLEEETHRGPPTEPAASMAGPHGTAHGADQPAPGAPGPAAPEGAMLDYMSKLYDLHFHATALGQGTKHAVGSIKSLANGGSGS